MFQKRKTLSITTLALSTQSLQNSHQEGATDTKNATPRGGSKLPARRNPFLGFFYTFAASVFVTLSSVFVKKLTYMSPGHLSLIRNAGVFAGCLPIAIYTSKEVFGPKKERVILIIRGFIGATALYLNLTAFRYLPLAEAAVVMSTTPVVTALLAFIYLKESFGLVQGVSLVLTVAGVLLSVRLPELLNDKNSTRFDYYYIVGLACGVSCVLFISIAYVMMRKMKNLHFSVLILYFGLIGMFENGIINATTSSFEYAQCGFDQVQLLLIGIFGFLGHSTITLAIQTEAAGIVAILKASTDIVVSLVFQVIFFSDVPDVYNISGACLVLISVGLMGVRNWLRTLREESNWRK